MLRGKMLGKDSEKTRKSLEVWENVERVEKWNACGQSMLSYAVPSRT